MTDNTPTTATDDGDGRPVDEDEWRERAAELREHGVPQQRANVVALREQGHSYSEIATKLEFGTDNDDRSQVKYHLDEFKKQLANSEWLIENGPTQAVLSDTHG